MRKRGPPPLPRLKEKLYRIVNPELSRNPRKKYTSRKRAKLLAAVFLGVTNQEDRTFTYYNTAQIARLIAGADPETFKWKGKESVGFQVMQAERALVGARSSK